MKLRLEDQGDGWFWDRPAIEVDVIGQTWVHSRPYYKVSLEPPHSAAAWLSARWVGHEFSSTHGTAAFLWLAGQEDSSGPPSVDSPPSARVTCREVG